MKKIELKERYIKEHIAPVADYSEKHINLIKMVEKVENGKEVAENLERNKNGFNFEGVKKGDIIKAVRYNRENKSAETLYYFVINITEDELTISEGFSSYYKCNKCLESVKENVEQIYQLIEKIKGMVNLEELFNGVA